MKVVVIGWDGATWDLINPWIDQGKLPFLKSLKESGAFGNLKSTVPPLTPPAWTTIFTGVNPGKHGVFDFFELDGYKRYPVLSSDRRVDAIWQTASKEGKKVYVIGVPTTFPPDQVNGVMVSGLGTPGPASDFVYPRELKDEVLEILGGNDLFIKDIPLLFAKDRKGFLEKVHDLMDKQKDLCLRFLEKEEWDLFVSVFMGIDWIAHFFWKDMDESHPGYDPKESVEFKNAIENIYIKFDQLTAEIYERVKVKGDVALIVLSDHGLGPVQKDIYINTLLKERGFLFAKLTEDKRLGFKKRVRSSILGLINKLDRFGLRYYIPVNMRSRMKESTGLARKSFLDGVDWDKSKAFSFSSSVQGIRLNLKGREPRGAVEMEDYGKTVKEIRRILEDLEDPDTGEKVVKKTYSVKDVYEGPFISGASDIFVEAKDDYVVNAEPSSEVFGPARHSGVQRSGEHRENGIFLMGGVRRKNLKSVKAYDVAPTILKYLGIKSSSKLDGRSLSL